MSSQVLRIAKGSLRWQQRKTKRVMVLNLFLSFFLMGPAEQLLNKSDGFIGSIPFITVAPWLLFVPHSFEWVRKDSPLLYPSIGWRIRGLRFHFFQWTVNSDGK